MGLNVSVSAEKQLAVFDQLVEAQEWEPALELVDRLIAGEPDDVLIRVEAGRFVALRAVLQQRLMALPEAGLVLYRRRADAVAKRLFEQATVEQDEALFRRIVGEYAATSVAPQAVLELLERAWRRGDGETALRLSQRLVDGTAGDTSRAKTLLLRSREWLDDPLPIEDRKATRPPPEATSLGTMRWYIPATISVWPSAGPPLDVALASRSSKPPTGSPRELVMINDGWQIHAIRETGGAYWATGIEGDPGTLTQQSPPENGLALERVAEGVLHGDRYFGIIGDRPVWNSRQPLTPGAGSLTAIDLGSGEGRIIWRVEARDLPEPGWGFHGPPRVIGTRVIAPICHAAAQVQLAVAAWETDTGRFAWWQRIGTLPGQTGVPVSATSIETIGDLLGVRTSAGVVLTMDGEQGRIRWASTTLVTPGELTRSASTDRLLAHAGRIVALDATGTQVRAFSADSGVTPWRLPLTFPGRGLTLASRGRCLIDGRRLICIPLATGVPVWEQGVEDPLASGLGRPVEVGQTVYWPARDGLWGIETTSGRIVERHRLSTGPHGGPMVLSAGRSILTAASPAGVWGLTVERDSAE